MALRTSLSLLLCITINLESFVIAQSSQSCKSDWITGSQIEGFCARIEDLDSKCSNLEIVTAKECTHFPGSFCCYPPPPSFLKQAVVSQTASPDSYYNTFTTSSPADQCNPNANKAKEDCDVLIIGTGFAGTYAAYNLAPQFGNRLCIVEKYDRDGGRIYDYSEVPGGPVIGAGTLRLTVQMKQMFALADRLGIKFQHAEFAIDNIRTRGKHYKADYTHKIRETTKMCRESFSSLACTEDPSQGKTADDLMLDVVLNLTVTNPALVDSYPDYQSLVSALFDDEGLAYYKATTTFDSDIMPSTATTGIMDSYERDFSSDRFYPESGMSLFPKRMLEEAMKSNPRIWHGEPVSSIDRLADGRFQAVTRNRVITATKALCSIPPVYFANITGNVADMLRSTREFNAIKASEVATVAAWWNDRWWERSKYSQGGISRVVDHQTCFNKMEMPPVPYLRDQNATRAVYDDGACLDMWKRVINEERNDAALEKVVLDGLQKFFDDVVVPRPRTIRGYFFYDGWHLLKGDSGGLKTSDIFDWSHKPLAFDNFSLIGEAYNLAYPGWCNAARITVNAASKSFMVLPSFRLMSLPMTEKTEPWDDHSMTAATTDHPVFVRRASYVVVLQVIRIVSL